MKTTKILAILLAAVMLFCVSCKKDDTASGKDTILRALEKAGVAAPSHCRGGECGYCRSRLVSGKVYIPEGLDMRRLADSRYGYIHPCCSFPLTDIEIEVFPKR